MIRVIDSHTGGEPTRVVVSGGPYLGGGPVAQQCERFRREFDWFRSAVVNEPRGWDAMVGALLCPTSEPECSTGVIFFNNVGPLGMCVHGTIGLGVTLGYLGQGTGRQRIETIVGIVELELLESNRVEVQNVASYRLAKDVEVDVPGIGIVIGDIAWGGNWFFLINDHNQHVHYENIEDLTDYSWKVRQTLTANGITGSDGGEIDHIELFSPSEQEGVNSKNFVLCPGREYDRSPCGTGTSAKLACLAADSKLSEGQTWHQAGITGSVFEGEIAKVDDYPVSERVMPTIRGTAYITADSQLVLQEDDPLRTGIKG